MKQLLVVVLLAMLSTPLLVAAHEADEPNAAPEDPNLTDEAMGIMTDGQSTSTACTITSGACSTAGSSNYINRTLSYNTATGIFSGSIITNLCPNKQSNYFSGVLRAGVGSTAQCVKQIFPAKTYTFPAAAPLRGVVAYSMSGGASVYGMDIADLP